MRRVLPIPWASRAQSARRTRRWCRSTCSAWRSPACSSAWAWRSACGCGCASRSSCWWRLCGACVTAACTWARHVYDFHHRCVVQLSVLGWILLPIFKNNTWYVVMGYASFMLLVAAAEAAARPSYAYKVRLDLKHAPSIITTYRGFFLWSCSVWPAALHSH